VRTLRVARQSAIKARTQAANELHALLVTAPDAMRAKLRRLKIPQLVATAAAFRRSRQFTTTTTATKMALKSIALRYQHLSAEMHCDSNGEIFVGKGVFCLESGRGTITTVPTVSGIVA